MIVDCVDFDALEQQARRTMPPASWIFCETGADDEITATDNIAAWRNLRLRPRVLRDIVEVDTSVSLLGSQFGTPIMVAPTGRHHLFHPEGERATARGAAAAGALFVMSTSGATAVEDVAAESSGVRRNGSSSTCSLIARRPRRCSIAASRRASAHWCSPSINRLRAGARAPTGHQCRSGPTCAASTWSASRSHAPPTTPSARAW